MAPVELLARKVSLVAVKSSNVTVSISVGPVTTFSVGGSGGGIFPKINSGTATNELRGGRHERIFAPWESGRPECN